MKKKVWLRLAIPMTVLCLVALPGCKKAPEQPSQETTPTTEASVSGVLTWEDYLAMSPEQKDAFYQTFASAEAFEAWMASVKPAENPTLELPWATGKQPDAYTWEEYQALTLELQDAFYQWFDSRQAFERWMEGAKPVETTEPVLIWNKPGKLPDAYTWEEYQALSPEEREAFYRWFGSADAFAAWMHSAKPQESTEPDTSWDKAGKRPNEYTWDEYQALSPDEKEAFYQWFGSRQAFERWMASVKPEESTAPDLDWEDSEKRPNEYTWDEYQAMSPEEKDAFFLRFGSVWEFERWLESVRPQETLPVWEKPGKLPDAYTWEEYQALTPEEQDAFFLWFATIEDFERWLESVHPQETTVPSLEWNKPGKLPDAYTWEEYQKLDALDQERFYRWFGSLDAFEAWLDKVTG